MRSLPFTGGDEAHRQELEKLADPGYKAFHEGLIPGASMSYGVRLPDMRLTVRRMAASPSSYVIELSRLAHCCIACSSISWCTVSI